jgi:hypothetical protein
MFSCIFGHSHTMQPTGRRWKYWTAHNSGGIPPAGLPVHYEMQCMVCGHTEIHVADEETVPTDSDPCHFR